MAAEGEGRKKAEDLSAPNFLLCEVGNMTGKGWLQMEDLLAMLRHSSYNSSSLSSSFLLSLSA